MKPSFRIQSSRGSTIIEFAMVLPIVFMMFAGIAEFGRFYYARLTMQHAVREAARFAVTGNTLDDPDTGDPLTRVESIQQVILQQASTLELDVDQLQVDPPDGGGPSQVVTVTAGFTFNFVAPGIKQMFPGGTHSFVVSTSVQNEPFITE